MLSDEKGEDGEEDGAGDDEEEEVDELSGYHFMECTTLFVSYVYITSGLLRLSVTHSSHSSHHLPASKVFEDRLVNKGLVAEFPDFEAVYHLVIDAVDTYNELWEDAYRAQQMRVRNMCTVLTTLLTACRSKCLILLLTRTQTPAVACLPTDRCRPTDRCWNPDASSSCPRRKRKKR